MPTDEPDSREHKARPREYDLGLHYDSNLNFLDNTQLPHSRTPINDKISQETEPRISEPFYKPPQSQKP